MKFTLTITDASAGDLARLLDTLNGSTVSVQHHISPAAPQYQQPSGAQMPINPNNGDDDDNAPPAADAPMFDKTGLPWDERIHSGNKARTADGSWRKRRGVQDATVTAIEQELRARASSQYQQPQAPSQPAAPQYSPPANIEQVPQTATLPNMPAMQPYQPPAMPSPDLSGQPPNPQYQPAMPSPEQPQQPQAPSQPGPTMDFHTFMNTLAAQMQKRDGAGMPLITADYLGRITQEINAATGRQLNAITDAASDPGLIGFAIQLLQRDGRWS